MNRYRVLGAGCLVLGALCTVLSAHVLGAQVLIRPSTKTEVSLWYRGLPAGVPRQVDLDAISRAGFTAVTWPTRHVEHALELRRMADRAGLHVVIRTDAIPLTVANALSPDSHVDILIDSTPIRLLPALLWRAVGRGARVISFDAGQSEGTGISAPNGGDADWVTSVQSVIRQLLVNKTMVDMLTGEPEVRLDPVSPGLDVVLRDAGRSWVLIVTNVAPSGTPPADTYVYLPRSVPPAEWLNLFDGSTIGMLRQDDAIRWHLVLGPGDVRVYAINKIER